MEVWTRKRSPPAQFWPQLRKAALMQMGMTWRRGVEVG
jgi:hypothetical protein